MTETGNNEVRQHVGTISVKNIAIGKARTVGRISEAPSAVCYQPPKAQDRVWIREAGPADGATLIRPTVSTVGPLCRPDKRSVIRYGQFRKRV